LRSIRFIDSNTGWIVGGNDILQTTDGGETWVMQEAPSVRIHQYDYKDD